VLKVVDLEPFNDTEEKKCAQLEAPKKPDRKCMIQLDEHQKYLIQKTVHSFFWNLESLPICIKLSLFLFSGKIHGYLL
jgi:hypothetical protein